MSILKSSTTLVPFAKPRRLQLTALFQEMEVFRAIHPLNPKGMEKISYRDLINGGRKDEPFDA